MPNRSQNHDGVILGRPKAGKSFSQLLFKDEDWAKKNLNTITLVRNRNGKESYHTTFRRAGMQGRALF